MQHRHLTKPQEVILLQQLLLFDLLKTSRLDFLRKEILGLTQATRIDEDAGMDPDADENSQLMQLDQYLCEYKES